MYYSYTGNNQFLAEKIAEPLRADIRSLEPRIRGIGSLTLWSRLKWKSGIDLSREELGPYEEVIILGPVWSGLLLAPLRDAIRLAVRDKKPIHFATCCGASDADKEGKWGYQRALDAAQKAGKGWVKTIAAFPKALVMTPEQYRDPLVAQEIRIREDNYYGDILERVTRFTTEIQRSEMLAAHP
jgi:flavodoxin